MQLRPNPNRRYEDLKLAAERARRPYDKDAFLNLAFYLDEQYVEWSADAASIRTVPRTAGFENTPRPVANKINHFVLQEHAMALQTRPSVDVLPATDDPVDLSEAEVALAYLRWLSEPQVEDFDAELSDAVMWALAVSQGFLKWSFNPQLKRPSVCSVSPFDIYLDPFAKKFKDCRYIIHSQFLDVEQVYDMYAVEVKPTDTAKADPVKSQLLRDMGQAPVLQGVVVNELWMKPCRRYPAGHFVAWTERQQLVEPTDFPYAHKRLPFTQIGSIQRPGVPHYTCAVKYLRSPQMELNKYHAQRIQIREKFANPKWGLDAALELDHDPDDSPSQILKYNSQGGTIKPEILQPAAMADNNEGQWITDEMMHVVGLHEVSQAQVPGRVESSKAIELLKEADAGRLAELLRTIKSSISEGYWQALMLAKQFVPDEQIVQTYSREGMPEVKRFKAEKLAPGLRVRVTMDTGLARSRSARQEQLMTMWQNQIITDPELMAELMEMPISTFEPGKAFDLRLARNENMTIADGTAVKPNSWDDHGIHIREHNNFRKTTEYLSLDEETKQKFEFHVKMHEEFQMQQMLKLVKQQALAQQLVKQQALAQQLVAGGAPQPGQPADGAAAPSEDTSQAPTPA